MSEPAFLNSVEWDEVKPPDEPGDLPYATHHGVLELFGCKLRCYRLSNGQAVFHADDFKNFVGDWFQEPGKEGDAPCSRLITDRSSGASTFNPEDAPE